MGKIFRYLWESKGAVILTVLLLIIQALCDLSLPQYTSDIVDIGIQQGGIAHVAMEEMRPETYENICLFLSEADMEQFTASYEVNAEGNYERTVKDSGKLAELDGILGMPLVVISGIQEAGRWILTP